MQRLARATGVTLLGLTLAAFLTSASPVSVASGGMTPDDMGHFHRVTVGHEVDASFDPANNGIYDVRCPGTDPCGP